MAEKMSRTDALVFHLKREHANQVDYLREQILNQKKEIEFLKNQIKLITEGRTYDC
jgi:hypothetical protein